MVLRNGCHIHWNSIAWFHCKTGPSYTQNRSWVLRLEPSMGTGPFSLEDLEWWTEIGFNQGQNGGFGVNLQAGTGGQYWSLQLTSTSWHCSSSLQRTLLHGSLHWHVGQPKFIYLFIQQNKWHIFLHKNTYFGGNQVACSQPYGQNACPQTETRYRLLQYKKIVFFYGLWHILHTIST